MNFRTNARWSGALSRFAVNGFEEFPSGEIE